VTWIGCGEVESGPYSDFLGYLSRHAVIGGLYIDCFCGGTPQPVSGAMGAIGSRSHSETGPVAGIPAALKVGLMSRIAKTRGNLWVKSTRPENKIKPCDFARKLARKSISLGEIWCCLFNPILIFSGKHAYKL